MAPPSRVTPLDHRRLVDVESKVEWHEVSPGNVVFTRAALADFSVQPGVDCPLDELAARRGLPQTYATPPVDVLRLRHAWLETRMCMAITCDHQYVADTLRTLRQAEEVGYRKVGQAEFILPESEVASLDGRAVLVGLPTGRNYFHWLLEAVSRWLLARDQIDADVRMLVPKIGPMERSALTAVGVPDDRIVVVPKCALLHVEELIVPPRGLRSSVRILPSATSALRSVASSSGESRGRFFVSRTEAWRRRIDNEPEVRLVLERHGFEAIHSEKLDVARQIELFSTAEVVLGLHGAGLANFVFAPPGATLVELQPPGLDPARLVLYWNLAAASGQRYVQILCAEAPDQAQIPRSERDVIVAPTHLDAVLGRVLSPPI